jgi:hypothetical protein
MAEIRSCSDGRDSISHLLTNLLFIEVLPNKYRNGSKNQLALTESGEGDQKADEPLPLCLNGDVGRGDFLT